MDDRPLQPGLPGLIRLRGLHPLPGGMSLHGLLPGLHPHAGDPAPAGTLRGLPLTRQGPRLRQRQAEQRLVQAGRSRALRREENGLAGHGARHPGRPSTSRGGDHPPGAGFLLGNNGRDGRRDPAGHRGQLGGVHQAGLQIMQAAATRPSRGTPLRRGGVRERPSMPPYPLAMPGRNVTAGEPHPVGPTTPCAYSRIILSGVWSRTARGSRLRGRRERGEGRRRVWKS